MALVTAQERGVAIETISIPEYEDLATEPEPVINEAVTQTDTPEVISVEAAPAEPPQSIAQVTAEETTEATTEDTTEAIEEAVQRQNQEVVQAEDQQSPEAVEQNLSEPELPAEVETQVADVSADLTVPEPIELSASDSEPLTDALQSSVEQWITAWQGQSLPDYFASYHTDFVPRYQDSQAEWRSNRQRVIGGADSIALEMSDFQFVGEEEGMLEVRFWLRYQSSNYSDNTQKKLLLLQEQGSWKIKEEINLQVRR